MQPRCMEVLNEDINIEVDIFLDEDDVDQELEDCLLQPGE